MTEPTISSLRTAADSPEAADAAVEPSVPAEAAAVLTAAGLGALTEKLANRWALVGTAALAALVVGVLLVRGGRRPSLDRA
jgi:hypothetical protein